MSPLSSNELDKIIFYQLRLPRVLLGLIAGAILGGAGLVFQSLFRNNLASPYTLGVSSGAAFGASLAISLQAWLGISFSTTILSFGFPGLMAFLGALITIGFIYLIGKTKRNFHPSVLILSGVVASFFFSSCIVFLHFMNDSYNTKKIIQWTLGDLSVLGFDVFWVIIPVFIFFTLYLLKMSLSLNVMAIGDNFAISRGLNIQRLRMELFILISLCVSIIISFTGPISFVGLIVPHIVKKLWGVDFRENIFPTLVFSGVFLIFCDFIAHIMVPSMILPVGVITSFLGGPFFLLLILKGKEI